MDDIKTIEARAYSRGYQAGKKRRTKEQLSLSILNKRNAFRNRAFLSVLPFCMEARGWTWSSNGNPIETSKDKIKWAWSLADQSLNEMQP